jgi:hypothetical protein
MLGVCGVASSEAGLWADICIGWCQTSVFADIHDQCFAAICCGSIRFEGSSGCQAYGDTVEHQ